LWNAVVTVLALLRHGPTDWTDSHRLQGRRDLPLSAAGRAAVKSWRLPEQVSRYRRVTSPLKRAVETAEILGGGVEIEPRLIEMDWGGWQGETLDALRQELGEDMVANEARGLDFRPQGGESPREVLDRLAPWFEQLGHAGEPVLAVTHKGVIRAVMARATGWDMTGKPPAKTRWGMLHMFEVDRTGGLRMTDPVPTVNS
jgi:probable phosphoglycerate mutase